MNTATAALPKSRPGPVERALFPPASLAVRERDALADAGRLAQLWDAALRASFQLGYDTGHRRGVVDGRTEEATAWQAIVTGYSELIDAPTRAELAAARRPSNDPCTARCGACSQCIRADAVTDNLARYGCPDRPGQQSRHPRTPHRKDRP